MAAAGGATAAAPSAAAAAAAPASVAGTIFLAWCTSDLAEEREKLCRELEARSYKVVPASAPPLDAAGVRERIVAALKDAKVAIHLIGANYGFVPEGEARSIIELQVTRPCIRHQPAVRRASSGSRQT